MISASRLVVDLAAKGRHHFTTEEAVRALGTSLPAVRASLRRLKSRGEIADPFRGFHLILAPEYRKAGCLPPEQFIPHLMKFLGEPYYVALLSAADLHVSGRHGPGAFQVMVKVNRRGLSCGRVHVQFVARKDLETTPVDTRIVTGSGALRVSSPEATALELVGYADQCGGLDNVASILPHLVARLRPEELVKAASSCPVAWVQRLGYLLDGAGHEEMADHLQPLVEEAAHVVAPLVRAVGHKGCRRDPRWRLAVNATIAANA